MPRPPTDAAGAVGLAALVLVAAAACARPAAVVEPSPADVALAVHLLPALADEDGASLPPALDALVHPDVLPVDAGALLDALQSLPWGRLHVRSTGSLPDLDRSAVQLDVLTAGGGRTRYELHLERHGKRWKLRWLSGPALSWPASGQRRGPALSTSAEPDPG